MSLVVVAVFAGFAEAAPRLDDASAGVLARVVREGATNVWRHSLPQRVAFDLSVADRGDADGRPIATLMIRNDGLRDGTDGSGRDGEAGSRAWPNGSYRSAGRWRRERADEFVLEASVPVPPRRGRPAWSRRQGRPRVAAREEMRVGHRTA